jgi:uncharacterized membrane protein YfcA
VFIPLLVIFLAALVRSTFGFGDAVVALPLLALLLGLTTATPLVALVSFTLALGILLQSWQAVDFRAIGPLVLAAVVTTPLGVLVLTRVEGVWLLRALGVFLIGFGLYRLIAPRVPKVEHPAWALALGFLGGVLGGAYGTNGPPAVLYGSLRRWPPETFRATMQGYFLITLAAILIGHAVGGLWSPEVWRLYAFSLPVIAVAVVLGRALNRRIPTDRFARFVDLALIVLGVLLIV